MRGRKSSINPALRHGGYSAMSVLPGENKTEFDKLHRDLISEIAPNGAFEDDLVATLTRLLWRKQNLRTFRIAEHARARCAQIRLEKIPEDRVDCGIKTFGTVIPVDPTLREAGIRAAEDQIRRELGETYTLVELGEVATVECLMKELDLQDRLDAAIERCIKRLLMVRGLKSISNASSSAPPARLPGPSRAA
jgi:hypothetical protein